MVVAVRPKPSSAIAKAQRGIGQLDAASSQPPPDLRQPDAALSANMNETPSPWKFSVEGETGFEDVYGHGDVRDDDGDRGGGEGAATAVHGDREAARAEGGRRLYAPR